MGAVAALWGGSAGASTLKTSTSAESGPFPVAVEGNVFRPEYGEHPGLVMFTYAAASNATNAAVAQQLAAQGWSVMLVPAKSTASYENIRAEARQSVHQLLARPGVAALAKAEGSPADAYVLRNISAAKPKLSLASRAERQAAASSCVLFSVPAALVAKDKKRMESLVAAARALQGRAA